MSKVYSQGHFDGTPKQMAKHDMKLREQAFNKFMEANIEEAVRIKVLDKNGKRLPITSKEELKKSGLVVRPIKKEEKFKCSECGKQGTFKNMMRVRGLGMSHIKCL